MKDSLSVVWCYGMDTSKYYTFCLVNSEGDLVTFWSDFLSCILTEEKEVTDKLSKLVNISFCLVPLEFFE